MFLACGRKLWSTRRKPTQTENIQTVSRFSLINFEPRTPALQGNRANHVATDSTPTDNVRGSKDYGVLNCLILYFSLEISLAAAFSPLPIKNTWKLGGAERAFVRGN